VKAQALPDLLPELAKAIAPSALLMPAVNGLPWWYFQGASRHTGTRLASLDPDGTMLPLFAAERLIGCVVYTRAAMNDDGDVVVQGQQALRIGRIAPGPAPQAIGEQLAAGGINVSVGDNVRREVWQKLMRNASTNLISGLTGATLEQIGRDPGLTEIVRGIAREIAGLSERLGCPVEDDLDGIVDEIRRAGPHATSTLQDIRAGREPELDALAEAPLEAADLVRHPMPILRHLLALLRARLRTAAA
jgi:2-dehydropantoate 2-reductase